MLITPHMVLQNLGQVHCNRHYHILNCILQEPSR